MDSRSLLLAPFFEQKCGLVIYKGYPPHRGDDVPALVELASVLPGEVEFVPISPEADFVGDIRLILPALLADEEIEQELFSDASWRHGELRWPEELPSELEGGRSRFQHVVREALSWLAVKNPGHALFREGDIDALAEEVVRRLEDGPRVLYRTLLLTAGRDRNLPVRTRVGPRSRLERRDRMRGIVHVPEDRPILILGRPELYLGYRDCDGLESTDFRRIVREAGYPNRFHFGDAYNDESDRYAIRDRKMNRVYRYPSRPTESDVGFIFQGATHSHQSLTVATGTSALGTLAAVRLLISGSPEIDAAVQRRDRLAPEPLDIGFHCQFERLARERPFHHLGPSERLRMRLINTDDLLGYRWAGESIEWATPLVVAWSSGKEPSEIRSGKHMTWRSRGQVRTREAESQRVLTVEIEVDASYVLSSGRRLLPSEPLGKLLDRIAADAETDRRDWRQRLEHWLGLPECSEAGLLEVLREDKKYQTFRPILLLGPTGAGKKWISDYIAGLWGGRTLRSEMARFVQSDKNADPHPHVGDWLMDAASAWMEGLRSRGADQQITVSLKELPTTLVQSELFGILERTATEVHADVASFLMAGTSLLLLDEFLEIDRTLQTTLLVALDSGKVTPVGSHDPYPYLARVVAATNRAHDEEQLQTLVDRSEVRDDLIARFTRRYSVPGLSERPHEIIPTLINQIVTHRLPGHALSDVTLRVSRPAFDVLIGYSYPYNNRDLEGLASDLPDALVSSMTGTQQGPWGPANALCLEHLSRFGVDIRGKNPIDDADLNTVILPGEVDFYEFTIKADEETGRGSGPLTLDQMLAEGLAKPMIEDRETFDRASRAALAMFRKLSGEERPARIHPKRRDWPSASQSDVVDGIRQLMSNDADFAHAARIMSEKLRVLRSGGLGGKKLRLARSNDLAAAFRHSAWTAVRLRCPLRAMDLKLPARQDFRRIEELLGAGNLPQCLLISVLFGEVVQPVSSS